MSRDPIVQALGRELSVGAAGAAAATTAVSAGPAAALCETNPFPGLRPFEPEESELFFGREDDIQDILSRLRRTRFLAVLGSSGCGKSSVVRAGLVASIQDGFMADAESPWRVAMMHPGDNPFAQLAAALNQPEALGRSDAQTDEHVALMQATLRRGPLGIVEAAREASLPHGSRLLVLVDQFEELFRFARGGGPGRRDASSSRAASVGDGGAQRPNAQDEARAFVKLLLASAASEDAQIYVVLTMRSEFLGRCAAFPGLPDAINRGLYLLPQMNREQMAAVIAEPVASCGGQISNRLVNRLLNDLGEDADNLPVLQHALMRLWALWSANGAKGPIDLSHYESVGQLQGSLSKHAEETYGELNAEQQKAAEKLFRLITDTTPDNQKVRRPLPLSEICELATVRQEQLVPVIEKFREEQRSFLMPPHGVELRGDTVIDISHESLIRQWARLRDWADLEARESRVYRRLVVNAAAWDEAGRSSKSSLYQGSRLAEAEEWRNNHPGRLEPVEIAFLKASRSAADIRTNLKLLVVSLACVAAVVLWFWTSYQKRLAEDQRAVAEKLKKEADAQTLLAQSRAQETQEALTKVQQQQDLLNQVFSNLFISFGGSAQLVGRPDLNSLMSESLAANEALKQIPSTEDLERRAGTLIKIFIKDKQDEKRVNASIVQQALIEKGFPQPELAGSKQRDVPINAVWADPNMANMNDTKTVAYVLIRAGFQVRYIGRYPNPRKAYSPTPVIWVGGDPNAITGREGTVCRPLTVQEIKDASSLAPLCFPPATAEASPDGGQSNPTSPATRAAEAVQNAQAKNMTARRPQAPTTGRAANH